MATPHSSRTESLLYWLMLLAGTAVLAPCLILPAWLEYRVERERRAAVTADLAEQRRRLEAVNKQIEHIHTDPAYVLRLAEREFGDLDAASGQETIEVALSPDSAGSEETAVAVDEPGVGGVTSCADDLLRRYPQAHYFVDGSTRPVLMVSGAGLIVAAVVLLGNPRRGAPRAGGEE